MESIGRRAETMLAGEIMTSPAVACREETFFEEVAEMLADREISGLPVVNADQVVTGVISERDLAHALGGPIIRLALRRPHRTGPFLREAHDLPRESRRAKDIMTSPPVVARPETPLHTLAEMMVKDELNRIPIVDRDRLVGVVTRGDILAALAGLRAHAMSYFQSPVVVGSGIAGGVPEGVSPGLYGRA